MKLILALWLVALFATPSFAEEATPSRGAVLCRVEEKSADTLANPSSEGEAQKVVCADGSHFDVWSVTAGRSCSSSWTCGVFEQCINRQCVRKSLSNRCSISKRCPITEKCINGVCVR